MTGSKYRNVQHQCFFIFGITTFLLLWCARFAAWLSTPIKWLCHIMIKEICKGLLELWLGSNGQKLNKFSTCCRVSIKNYKQCWLVKGCSSLLEFQNKFQSNCIDRVVWTFYYVRITLVGWEFRAGDSDIIVYWIQALYSNFSSSVTVNQISTQLMVLS